MTDKPKRRWYQYSLRSLFVVTTLVACACSWYAYEMNEAAKRRAAIKKIEKLGGEVEYSDYSGYPTISYDSKQHPQWYSWLRKLHGDEYLGNAVVVILPSPAPGWLRGPTTGLIWSRGNIITDDDLLHLRSLTNIKVLSLWSTPVTDAGLVHLENSTNLEKLDLSRTQVTDEGVKKLQEALPNCRIVHKLLPLTE